MTKKKYKLLDYLFVFILIFYAASATNFTRSLGTWEVIEGLLFIVFFTVYYAIVNKIIIKREFYILLGIYTIYFILLTIKFKELHPRFFAIYLISFFITFISLERLKNHFFLIYEDILYYLCFIALVFWIINLIIPIQLSNFMDQISFYKPGSNNVKSNIIFFTLNNINEIGENASVKLGSIKFIRNSGFAWEPGAFAVFTALALFLNIIKSKFKNIINRRFFIYFFCLISTFSTTGFAILFVIFSFYLYNTNVKFKIFYLVILISIGLSIYTSDIINDKLNTVISQDTDEQIQNSITYNVSYTPQRYTSFLIDFKDFLNNPILGYGGHNQERWTTKLGAQIESISGIGKLLARFGIIGTIFFIWMLIKSSKKLSLIFGFKGWGFLLVIIIMISISYSLIENPLIMCFWLFGLFTPMMKLKKN